MIITKKCESHTAKLVIGRTQGKIYSRNNSQIQKTMNPPEVGQVHK